MPLLILILLGLSGFWASPPETVAPADTATSEAVVDHAALLFEECGLAGEMNEEAWRTALAGTQAHGASAHVLAVADMTRPSTEKRLFIVDLDRRKLLLRTWVAHGKNSGDLYCEQVSNMEGSLQTSKGLYRVGEKIISPKHGDALLLYGLDEGTNSAALKREIIVHAADYVGADFIARHGRLGRSFGCPAVAPAVMPEVVEWLQGQLLFVYAH